MRKLGIAAASAMLGTVVALSMAMPSAYAADKVDCDAVMQSLGSGKKAKEVAAEMSISVSSVYRCKRHAKQEAKSETKSQKTNERSSEARSAGGDGGGAAPEASPAPANP